LSKTYQVGDVIRDDDYKHLPIGTEACKPYLTRDDPLCKTTKKAWVSVSGFTCRNDDLFDPRTITKLPETAAEDFVNEPPHYKIKDGVEVIDVIEALAKDDWYFGSAIKYLLRHKAKGNPKQDLEKCRWMIDKMLEGLS
jgi:hypothetical protein